MPIPCHLTLRDTRGLPDATGGALGPPLDPLGPEGPTTRGDERSVLDILTDAFLQMSINLARYGLLVRLRTANLRRGTHGATNRCSRREPHSGRKGRVAPRVVKCVAAAQLDGVYVHQDDDPRAPLEFLELDAPSHADIAEVAARTAARIEKILREHGRSLDPERDDGTPPELALDEPGLAACYAAAARGVSVSGERAGKLPLRLITSPESTARPRAAGATDEPIAEVRGINIHAAQAIDGRDRRRVERICKYITRPPVAQDRLERRADGKLELSFKRAWRDGTACSQCLLFS